MANLTAKDLRIGNLIFEIVDTPNDPNEKRLFEVYSINSFHHTLCGMDENITQIDYCEPIHLTHEILEAAGFRKDKSDYFTLDLGFGYTLSTLYITPGVALFCKGEVLPNPFGYLHELQNLYHSLTGEELTINLNQLQQAL